MLHLIKLRPLYAQNSVNTLRIAKLLRFKDKFLLVYREKKSVFSRSTTAQVLDTMFAKVYGVMPKLKSLTFILRQSRSIKTANCSMKALKNV